MGDPQGKEKIRYEKTRQDLMSHHQSQKISNFPVIQKSIPNRVS